MNRRSYLLFVPALVLLLMLSGSRESNARTGACTTIHSDSGIVPLVLNIRGDTILLGGGSAGNRLVLVFFNTYSCLDCFHQLQAALSALIGHDTLTQCAALLRVENNILLKRAGLDDIRRAMPGVSQFYFDMKDAGDDPVPPVGLRGGLFGAYGISRTPALLIIDGGEVPTRTFISYGELFPAGESADPTGHLITRLGREFRRR